MLIPKQAHAQTVNATSSLVGDESAVGVSSPSSPPFSAQGGGRGFLDLVLDASLAARSILILLLLSVSSSGFAQDGKPKEDFLDLVLGAGLAAQSILLLLLVLLFFTVWFILRKRLVLRRYEAACAEFERAFWGGVGIGALAARARGGEFGVGGLAAVFLAGQGEFDKQKDAGVTNPEIILTGVRRAMDAAVERENQQLDRHMEFLSTTAGFSPYVGLLGTVWGIINAFSGLIDSSQATIAQVAPGIAEALVATAMGLIVAIPALIAFNHFSSRLGVLESHFEIFEDSYLNILARNL